MMGGLVCIVRFMREGLIGKSVPHTSSLKQASGEAIYVIDTKFPNETVGWLVTSKHENAKILKIDTSNAENYPGVLGIYTHRSEIIK